MRCGRLFCGVDMGWIELSSGRMQRGRSVEGESKVGMSAQSFRTIQKFQNLLFLPLSRGELIHRSLIWLQIPPNNLPAEAFSTSEYSARSFHLRIFLSWFNRDKNLDSKYTNAILYSNFFPVPSRHSNSRKHKLQSLVYLRYKISPSLSTIEPETYSVVTRFWIMLLAACVSLLHLLEKGQEGWIFHLVEHLNRAMALKFFVRTHVTTHEFGEAGWQLVKFLSFYRLCSTSKSSRIANRWDEKKVHFVLLLAYLGRDRKNASLVQSLTQHEASKHPTSTTKWTS